MCLQIIKSLFHKEKKKCPNARRGNYTKSKIKQEVPGQLYLGVMEERERKGGAGSLWGGALQKGFGGISSSSIGQTI